MSVEGRTKCVARYEQLCDLRDRLKMWCDDRQPVGATAGAAALHHAWHTIDALTEETEAMFSGMTSGEMAAVVKGARS